MIAGGSVVEDLKVLVELQEIDLKIHELETDRARKPRILSLAAEAMREAREAMEEAQSTLEKASKDKRALDTELQAESDRILKMKLRSPEIKTNKEYFTHLKEIEDCQKKVGTIEEKTLELMEKIEKAEADLAGKRGAFTEEEAKFNEAKVRIEEQFSSHDGALAELQARRAELLPKVSRQTAAYYEGIVTRYPDSPVAEALGGACTGCRMQLPPQVYNNVRKGENIVTCTQCARILFYKDLQKVAQ